MEVVSIRKEIIVLDDDGRPYIDSQRLKNFIDKYGANYKEHKPFGFNMRLFNYIHLMNYEQLKMLFGHKPLLIFGFKFRRPYTPESIVDDIIVIMIINVIIECYNNNAHFRDWKEIIMKGCYDKRIITMLENHDRRTKTFFELMKDRLIE